MSPPEEATESSYHVKQNGAAVESLGEALAGVNIGSKPSSSNFVGSSAIATAPFAIAPSGRDNDGWGNFVTPVEDSGALENSSHVRNESLELFLSQSPSQTLGKDVFKFSHTNLPVLAEDERTTGIPEDAFRMPGNVLAPSVNAGFGEIHRLQEGVRRRTDSPSCSATGTTSSSRSVSPYGNTSDVSGGRNIQAYQTRFDAAPAIDTSSTMNLSHHSPFGKERNQIKSPYGSYESWSSSTTYSQTVDPSLHQLPPMVHNGNGNNGQVLYMAMPSPDGRGQVLQPVQMMQLPGKPYTYVVPGSTSSLQGGIPTPILQNNISEYGSDVRTSRVLSGNNYLADNNNFSVDNNEVFPCGDTLARDDYSQNSAASASQFANDPVIASLYASPQRPPLEALLGQVRRLARDQIGCRLVQQALDEEGTMAATLILQEGLPFWGEAMVDPFGNYLFQKILEKVTPEERIMLVKNVSTRLVNASLNLHGTRSVQKVVELCAQDEQDGYNVGVEESAAFVLTKSLAPAAARLCIDSHGNHVIQRILLRLGPHHSKFVFEAVAASVGDVGRHRHGCCVIQRCLDSPPTEFRAQLVRRIVEKSLELMQDAYGNYVVQYVLDVCSDDDVHAVCESVVGKANLLAIQKFSSNVMEKCLERCTDRVKELYLLEMSDPERIRELMMDPFGNYVVQRALSVATHSQAIRLVEAMRPHLIAAPMSGPNGGRNGGVRNTAGGRRIIAKICRRFPNFTLNPVGTQEELYSQNKGNHRYLNHHQQGGHMQQQQLKNSPMLSAYPPIGSPMQYPPDPRMSQMSIQPQHYGLGGNPGYYDPFSDGHGGGYTGM